MFDFPNAPTVGQVYSGYVWDGEKWLTQPAKGSKKNYIINGAMMVSQENGNTPGTTTAYYAADMWNVQFSNAGAITFADVAARSSAGSTNRLRLTVTTADASVGAGDYCEIGCAIEGVRAADLNFGLASAKTIVIQFGVKAPAGTYSVTIANGASNRNYAAEYVIAAGEANTDVIKSVTIPGDVTGTWPTGNVAGIYLQWSLMCGSTYAIAPNTWSATTTIGSSNQFNFMGTNGNVFELFDVSLTEGNVAPPFQVPDYASELEACRRYYQQVGGANAFERFADGQCLSTTSSEFQMFFNPVMRSAPSFTPSGTTGVFSAAASVIGLSGLSAGAASIYSIQLTATTGASLVAGNATKLLSNNDITTRFKFSARL